MERITTTCPAALSFIFKYCPNDDPVKAGSIGVGCTVDKKVEVTVNRSGPGRIPTSAPTLSFPRRRESTIISINNHPITFPTVSDVVNSLSPEPVVVSIRSPLPLGCGFGVSGASALATAYSLNQRFNLKKTNDELAQIAHIAEIKNKTGLGTVGTQVTGGFLIKQAPGLPVVAMRLPFDGQKLYAIILGPLTTPSVLEKKGNIDRINGTADRAMVKIYNKLEARNSKHETNEENSKKRNDPNYVNVYNLKPLNLEFASNFDIRISNLTLGDILDISYDFVRESGLLNDPEMETVIEEIRIAGGHATMAILGRMIISNRKPTGKLPYRNVELTVSRDSVNAR